MVDHSGRPERGLWQPIETAPLGGKMPDIMTDYAKYAAAVEATERRVLVYGAGRMMLGTVRDFTGDDDVVRRGVGAGMGIFIATHWMPLPDPPADGALPRQDGQPATATYEPSPNPPPGEDHD